MTLEWKRSRDCSNAQCIEVLASDREVFIKNSIDPSSVIVMTREEFQELGKAIIENKYGI